MKFHVSKSYYHTVSEQLDDFAKEGTITSEQAEQMKGSYEIRGTIGVVQAVTGVGSIMIGLGILSYIAGNWDHMPNWGRLTIILLSMLGFFFAGVRLEKVYPRTGQAVRNVSVLVYGSGLFLVDQMFHLNRPIPQHFLFWAFGAALMAWVMRDHWMYLATQVLIGAAWMTLIEYSGRLEWLLTLMALLATVALIFDEEREQRGYLSAFNHLLILLGWINLLESLEVNPLLGVLVVLAYSVHWVYKPLFAAHAGVLNHALGGIVMGFSGFLLTFNEIWEEWGRIQDGYAISLVFSILFVVWQFTRIRSGSFTALLAICAIVARFYFDTFYDFMPKSLFFVVGGVMLTLFGWYLEALRRKEAASHAEQ